MRAARLWRHITMLKRVAMFFLGGVEVCTPGCCAVPCYACPSELDDLAIPSVFEAVCGNPWCITSSSRDKLFVHVLFRWSRTDYRQLNGNFRLKLKQRGLRDQPLNNGCAYIVREPPYKEYITQCGPQTEVSLLRSPFNLLSRTDLFLPRR